MSDARLDLGPDGADLVLEGGDLARDEGLSTAVLVSILSDARSDSGASSTTLTRDARGWWADTIRDRFGSTLWTLEREKRTAETLERARELGAKALAWLIEDGIASRLEVVAGYDEFQRLRLDVTIYRGTAARFSRLWNETASVVVRVAQETATAPAPVLPDQNVVVFLLDDGGAELFEWIGLLEPAGGYAVMPRLDEMRARGVSFTRAYACPICGPTRACVHTGRAGFRNGLSANMDGAVSAGFGLGVYAGISTEMLFARALRLGRDGTADQTLGASAFTYTSGWFGKGHIFADGGQELYPVSQGWGRYVGCPPNSSSLESWPVGQAAPNAPGDPGYIATPVNSGHFHWREIQTIFGGSVTTTTYGAGGVWPSGGPYEAWNPSTSPPAAWDAYKVYRDAIQWINARPGPFCAMVCLNPPHGPFEVPPYTFPDTVGHGATGATLPLIPAAQQAAMTALDGGGRGPGYRPPDGPSTVAVYMANLRAVDTLLGMFWDRMDPAKRDRTVFLWMGDNGTVGNAITLPYDFGHSKRTIYEQGARVPAVVFGSSDVVKSPGRLCDHLIHVSDIFPTLLEITGCDPEKWNPGGSIKIDGRSFFPVLQDPSAPPARTFVYNEIFLPIGAKLDGDPLGTPPIPGINAAQWTRSYTDGTYKIHQLPTGSAPPFRFFKITNEAQPGSGQPGYLELDEDNLYPLVIDGLHPELTERFNVLHGALQDLLAS